MRSRAPLIAIVSSITWALLACAAAGADEPGLVLLDGTRVEGEVVAIEEDGAVRLKGHEAPVPLDGLRRIERAEPVEPGKTPPCTVHLASGGVMEARDVTFDGERFEVTWAYGTASLPPETVGAVRLGAAAKGGDAAEFEAARARPEVPRDVLFAVAEADLQAVTGALAKITPEEVAFIWAGTERTIDRSRVYGLVMARRGRRADLAGRGLVHTADGSRLWGRVERLERGTLRLAIAPGVSIALPWKHVRRIDVRSRRMVFLSDLDPAAAEEEALVTFAGWQADRSVVGTPLRLGDRAWEKGLGMHARCRLEYEIGERFDTFAATVGLDATSEGRGDCVLRVEGDGRELWQRRVRGRDKPCDIRVDVAGVRRLAVEVLWGEGLDVGDRADWCDARLLKEADE